MLIFSKMVELKKKSNKSKGLEREIDLPEGVGAHIEHNSIHLKYQDKEIKRKFLKVVIEKKDSQIIIRTKRSTKREKKQINTVVAHIKNMLKGLKEDFVYKLQICAVHFPMTVSVQDGEVIIRNFLGEIKERRAKIMEGTEVEIEREIVTVSSANKEHAGQTAANIENAVQTKNKDKRIFQDGIFIIEKSGREML